MYDQQKFKDFCEVNDAPIVFDGIYEAMLPCRSDCILGSHQESAARLAMGTINAMCYSQSERFNWILWDMSNFFLHYHVCALFSDDEIGLGLGHRTFYRHSPS